MNKQVSPTKSNFIIHHHTANTVTSSFDLRSVSCRLSKLLQTFTLFLPRGATARPHGNPKSLYRPLASDSVITYITGAKSTVFTSPNRDANRQRCGLLQNQREIHVFHLHLRNGSKRKQETPTRSEPHRVTETNDCRRTIYQAKRYSTDQWERRTARRCVHMNRLNPTCRRALMMLIWPHHVSLSGLSGAVQKQSVRRSIAFKGCRTTESHSYGSQQKRAAEWAAGVGLKRGGPRPSVGAERQVANQREGGTDSAQGAAFFLSC